MKSRFYDKLQLEGKYIDLDYGYYTQSQLNNLLPNGILSVDVAKHTEVTLYSEDNLIGPKYVISNIANKSRKVPGFNNELNGQTVKSIKIECACRVDTDPYVTYEIYNNTFIRNGNTIAYTLYSVNPAPPKSAQDPPPQYNPIIVIIPDIGMARTLYSCVQDELAQRRFSSIILDLRGTGESSPSTTVTYIELINDYRTIIDDLKLNKKKPIVFGHGMGGAIAQLWGLTYRSELRNLILIDTAPFALFNLYNQLTSTQQWLSGLITTAVYASDVADAVYNTKSHDCQNTSLKQDLIDSYNYANTPTLQAMYTQNLDDYSMAKAPKLMPIPVLILHGTHDDVIALSGGVALHHLIPDSEFIKIRTGHTPFFTRPDPTYELIFHYLSPTGSLYIN
ncbi:alpha/beta hydrolase fold [Klosneuvirus KNV1]|uniref:Alpha/beta hydrolase fold n=1 Tax=Klosneuvirus KNV1 TaxID=1977640 RepID=A0A1V0SKH6_9VIRU|nr:alpha/beta hydrolase fold [Klosneuvirus KNV1]